MTKGGPLTVAENITCNYIGSCGECVARHGFLSEKSWRVLLDEPGRLAIPI